MAWDVKRGGAVNRTWADAAVDIFTAILSTIGPIGLGVVMIVGTIGAAIWWLDRRGLMRPQEEPAKFECKGGISERVLTELALLRGSNDAHHEATHDAIRRMHDDVR